MGAGQEGVQKHDIGPTKAPLNRRQIRMTDDDWEHLKRHFESKGIPVTTGIRSILKDYMKRQGL